MKINKQHQAKAASKRELLIACVAADIMNMKITGKRLSYKEQEVVSQVIAPEVIKAIDAGDVEFEP